MFRRPRRPGRLKLAQPEPEEAYLGLRRQVLTLDPASVGLGHSPIWGCVIEMGMANGVATLVCLADGTTSMYTSSGGGIIGAGAHQRVARKNSELLAVVARCVGDLTRSDDDSLPRAGQTCIRALTSAGQRQYQAATDDLSAGRSALSSVFHSAQSVITELRMIDGNRR